MSPRSSRTLRRAGAALVALAVATAAVTYARHIDWPAALGAMRQASRATLAVASACHMLSLLAKAGAWWLCLRALARPAFHVVARATFAGATLNSLFVGNSGEAGRVLLITRLTGLRGSAVLTTVALERLLNVIGFCIVLSVASFVAPLPFTIGRGLALAAVLALGAWLVGRHTPRGHRDGRARGRVGIARLRRKVRVFARRMAVAVRRIVTPGRVVIAVALTLCDWSFQLASYHLVARAAHLPMPLTGTLVALLAVNVGLVVRVTPGNVGIFELAYATAAHTQGVPFDTALGVGLLIHLVQDVPAILLGLVFGQSLLRSSRRGRPVPPSVALDSIIVTPAEG